VPICSEVIPSLYLAKSTETRYNNQSQEKDSFHEFLLRSSENEGILLANPLRAAFNASKS